MPLKARSRLLERHHQFRVDQGAADLTVEGLQRLPEALVEVASMGGSVIAGPAGHRS
jgi:hypothetical protein